MDPKKEENIIVIGNKGFMPYMRSLELILRKQRKKSVILKARGNNIKLAVDLAEASKNKFLDDLNIEIGEVKISTANFNSNRDVECSVSCIEIKLISN